MQLTTSRALPELGCRLFSNATQLCFPTACAHVGVAFNSTFDNLLSSGMQKAQKAFKAAVKNHVTVLGASADATGFACLVHAHCCLGAQYALATPYLCCV